MDETILLLGSNLGDTKKHISAAIELISKKIAKVKLVSCLYQTAAWGKTDQPDFINQAVVLDTNIEPKKLLQNILVIEKKLGRHRSEKWGSRIIDIDILFLGNQIIRQEDLTIPHPFLHKRRFTLMPLLEVRPDFVHPVLKETMTQLFEKLDDNLSVIKLNH